MPGLRIFKNTYNIDLASFRANSRILNTFVESGWAELFTETKPQYIQRVLHKWGVRFSALLYKLGVDEWQVNVEVQWDSADKRLDSVMKELIDAEDGTVYIASLELMNELLDTEYCEDTEYQERYIPKPSREELQAALDRAEKRRVSRRNTRLR